MAFLRKSPLTVIRRIYLELKVAADASGMRRMVKKF